MTVDRRRTIYNTIVDEARHTQQPVTSDRSDLDDAMSDAIKDGDLKSGEAEAAKNIGIGLKMGWIKPQKNT